MRKRLSNRLGWGVDGVVIFFVGGGMLLGGESW